jgi:hypothetical protein
MTGDTREDQRDYLAEAQAHHERRRAEREEYEDAQNGAQHDERNPPPPGEPDERLKDTTSRFVLTRFADIKPLDGDDDYCVKDVLPRSGLAVVWGPPKCGKSFWTFDLLMHVALGWKYRGHCVRQGPVVYVCLEGGRGFRKRKEAFRRAKLARPEDPDNPQFFLVTNPLSLAADVNRLIADIKRQVGEDIPVVVCIDTLNRSMAGSESKDEDMSKYIKATDAIRDAFDCLVVVVHHSPHDEKRPRGHSSLIGAADVQIAVIKDADDNTVATLELAKDMEVGLRFVSRLDKVELGQDADGDPVASCIVREVEDDIAKADKKPAGSRRSDDVAKVRRAIMDAYARLADAVDKTPGFDGKPVLKVPVDKLREQVKSRGFLETDDDGRLTSTSRKHFQRAKTDLIASKRFIEADGMFWRLYDIPQPREQA